MFDMFEAFKDLEKQAESGPVSKQRDSKLFVISAGGSIFFGQKPDSGLIASFSATMDELFNEGYRFVIVVGGGAVARNYVASAKSLGIDNFHTDLAAIQITRANASIMAGAIKSAYPSVLSDIGEARQIIDMGKMPVYGGILPSLTTDSVAALLAESLNATFVNLTNVDGIYSADPKKRPGAVLYEKIDYKKLMLLLKGATSRPGQNFVLDMPCCLILRRSGIRGAVLNGHNLENLKSFIRGYSFTGTLIEESAEEMAEEEAEEAEEKEERAGDEETEITPGIPSIADEGGTEATSPKSKRKKTAKRGKAKGNDSELRPEEIDY